MPDADSSAEDATETNDELPGNVVAEAERLTRLAREAVDDAEAAAYREERADLLADHGFTGRVRDDDPGETLVLHPEEWVEPIDGERGDGDRKIRTDRIEDIDRAVEVSLSGPGDPDEWDAVDEHNREVVARVREAHGAAHGENAAAFADFMSNHYAKPVEAATDDEIAEFLTEYYPRNVWPSENQREIVEETVELVLETTEP